MEFIIKHRGGGFLGEDNTWNSMRSYAKRFPSKEEAQVVASKITSFVSIEPYQVPGHGFGGTQETTH